jgi:hypothetical protein
MRTTVTAVVLSMFASVAAAQCVAQAPAAGAAQHGPQLIKTATAAAHDQALNPDDGPEALRQTASNSREKQHPRRTGGAMLLAAVALMSGIALRRFSAGMK